MQTKDKKKQWVEIPEDVSRKLRSISDIYSWNTLKAIVPAYCEYPYAHFVQKRGVSKFVLLQNFPVPTMFDNDPVGLDFSLHVMYAGDDEIFFGVGHKLQT